MVTPPRFQYKSNLAVVLLNFLSDFLKETRDFISPSLHRETANRSPLSPERASVARRGWLPAYVRNAVFPRTIIESVAEGSLWHCTRHHTCACTEATPWCCVFSSMHRSSVCKKDFSASLEMTIREGLFVILRATL